jgi:hypothetical protein
MRLMRRIRGATIFEKEGPVERCHGVCHKL